MARRARRPELIITQQWPTKVSLASGLGGGNLIQCASGDPVSVAVDTASDDRGTYGAAECQISSFGCALFFNKQTNGTLDGISIATDQPLSLLAVGPLLICSGANRPQPLAAEFC